MRRKEKANLQMALKERRLDEERQFCCEEAAHRESQEADQRKEREVFVRMLHAMPRKLA